jgi:bromodomain adjacent to zinc finger domain protein 1A
LTESLVYSRDRLLFSKVSLKRLLRDALDRDASMYSPWHVKEPLARAFNVPIEMSDELKHRIVSGREGALQERKAMIRRAQDDPTQPAPAGSSAAPEGEPPKKKQKKNPDKDKEAEGAGAEGSARKKNTGDGTKRE